MFLKAFLMKIKIHLIYFLENKSILVYFLDFLFLSTEKTSFVLIIKKISFS